MGRHSLRLTVILGLLITALDVYGLPESLRKAWAVITGG